MSIPCNLYLVTTVCDAIVDLEIGCFLPNASWVLSLTSRKRHMELKGRGGKGNKEAKEEKERRKQNQETDEGHNSRKPGKSSTCES